MIEFLFWEGCPSHERALAELIGAMDDHDLERDDLRITELHTRADAEREKFIGSPTIRIDGTDIVDPGNEGYGLNCRLYHRADGRPSPLPDIDVLRAAIADYAAKDN